MSIFKLFRDPNEKYLKEARQVVLEINDKEKEFESLTDEQLKERSSRVFLFSQRGFKKKIKAKAL